MCKKIAVVLMALAMLLSLTACKKKTAETPDTPAPPQTQTPAKQEPPAAPSVTLRPVEDVVLPADIAEGRAPGGEYVLPEEVTTMMDWQWQGAVGLLAQVEDISFYALEGKESCPALLRWGDSMAEFDWLYTTPQAIEPELWLVDMDGDGETEVVADCYGGSGTGVSLEYIYIVEKAADGTLTSHELPWRDLCYLVDKQLQLISDNGRVYAALGRELVDITASIPEGCEAENLCLGYIARYVPGEWGLECTFGVMAEGPGIQGPVYVANVEGFLSYENEVFTLTDLHLLSN